MPDHPEFFNVRKMAITFCAGPIAFLLVVIAFSAALHQFRLHASVQTCTTATTAGSVTGLYGDECP